MVDRHDRQGLPGYYELMARGAYHRLVGGPDHLDSAPQTDSEPVGTVFGFMEPTQSDDISFEEPDIFPTAGRPTISTADRLQEMDTIPTVQRHRVMSPSDSGPPLVQRKKPFTSRPETVEADCAPSYRHVSEEDDGPTIPSFGPSEPRLPVDPKKAKMVQQIWENQGLGSVDSGFGSSSVNFPSRDETSFHPSVNSLCDDVKHISIKEEEQMPIENRNIDRPPAPKAEIPETVVHSQINVVDNREPNRNTILDVTEKYERNLIYFDQDSDCETNMHNLIYADEDEMVLLLFDDLMSYHMLDIPNKQKQTILHVAAIMDKPKLCRAIMAHGASVDLRDVRGNTPLHIACQKGHMECVEILSKHLNYSEVKHISYQVPFRCIPQSLELRNYDGQTCVHLAAANGHYDIVHYLVHDLHADINAQEGKRGLTPLMQCVERRDARMLMYLVQQCQANIHARTYDRKNALELAEGRGFTDIANLLRVVGAEVDTSDDEDSDWIEEDVDDLDELAAALIGQ